MTSAKRCMMRTSGADEEDRAARDDAREPFFAQSPRIDSRIGHATEQGHHIARLMPRFTQIGEATGDTRASKSAISERLTPLRAG